MDIFDAVATTECPTCQEANGVELPDRPTDDSIAKCRVCGTDLGRWGDIKDAAARIIATRTHFVIVAHQRLRLGRPATGIRVATGRLGFDWRYWGATGRATSP